MTIFEYMILASGGYMISLLTQALAVAVYFGIALQLFLVGVEK